MCRVNWHGLNDMSTDSLRHVWARRARSMFLATPGLMRFWRCQWRAQSQTCAALIGDKEEIGGWCLAAGDSSFCSSLFIILFIIYLAFLHIPNIPMSHRQILGTSEARRPCQRGSWGIQEISWHPGWVIEAESTARYHCTFKNQQNPKVKETNLRSQTFTDYTDFQHLRAFGGCFPFDWTYFNTLFRREAEKLEEKAEAPPPPASPTSPPVEPTKLEPHQSEPAKLDTEDKADKKGKQIKKCCPLWGKFDFFGGWLRGALEHLEDFCNLFAKIRDPYLHRSRREFNRILSEILN